LMLLGEDSQKTPVGSEAPRFPAIAIQIALNSLEPSTHFEVSRLEFEEGSYSLPHDWVLLIIRNSRSRVRIGERFWYNSF
jgi:hypothetical protein